METLCAPSTPPDGCELVDGHCHVEDLHKDWKDLDITVQHGVSSSCYLSQLTKLGMDIGLPELPPRFKRAFGAHPRERIDSDILDKVGPKIAALAKAKKIVAIGEVGFDFKNLPEETQKKTFEWGVKLAQEKNK